MLKKISIALVCLVLAASLPARADNPTALDAFKQFMKNVATKNNEGAWNQFNEISKSMIRTKIFADMHASDPSVTDAQFDSIFTKERPKILAAFFDTFRKQVDFTHMLAHGNFRCVDYKGQLVGLAVDGDAKWAAVMVEENGVWKLDMDATMKIGN